MVMSAFRSHGWVYSTHRGCRADQRPNRPATRTVALAVGRDVIAGGGDPRWDRRGRDRSRGLGGHAGREGLDVLGAQRLAADAPVAACDLLDDDPGHRAHVLALDRHHRVGEALDDLVLLVGREDVLDELDVDERHGSSWWLDGLAGSGPGGEESWRWVLGPKWPGAVFGDRVPRQELRHRVSDGLRTLDLQEMADPLDP